VLDIASEAGLQKHNEDFGQTLGVWGVPSGPYLMLPLLGPSTIRDTAALPADIWADPWAYKDPVNVRNIGIGVRAVDQRASVLEASNLFEEAALDRYEFIRDGYLQRRQSRIYDGESGPETDAPKDQQKDEAQSNTQVVPEPASNATETQRK
jgi:phospholipid-binding lipoprotein MlaA